MRIRTAPEGFVNGGTLSPRMLNANLNHLQASIDDEAAVRYVHNVVRLPYHKGLTTGYTNADSDDMRQYTINLPVRWSIERAFLRYYGTTGAAVTLDVYEGATLWEDDYLTIPTGLSSSSASDFNGKRVECDANTDYSFRLVGSSFTSSNTWLELHIRFDRWNTAGTEAVPSYTPLRIGSDDARNASTLNTDLAEADTAITSLTTGQTWTRVDVYVAHGVSSISTASQYTWPVPAMDTDVVERTSTVMSARLVLASTPAGSTGGTWYLRNAAGTAVNTAAVATAATTASASDTTDVTIGSASSSPATVADDFSIEFDHDAGSAVVDKTYCLLIYS